MSALAYILKPVEVEIYGKKVKAIMNMAALSDYEEHTGESFNHLMDQLVKNKLTINENLNLLSSCFRMAGNEITVEDMRENLDPQEYIQLLPQIAAVKERNMPNPSDIDKELEMGEGGSSEKK